ncbi:MAG: nitroreductase family protein [Deinococcota bacterium]
MTTSQVSQVVDHVIRQRKTLKCLRDPAARYSQPISLSEAQQQALQTMVEVAGWAPFHKLADEATHRESELTSVVPWRFYVLEPTSCNRLLDFLEVQAETYPESPWTRAWNSKIPKLIAGAGALVQVTWLPDPTDDADLKPQLTINNMEHIAAASAAVQNLLLAAEARGWHTYWSSGGILKTPEVLDYLGIARTQMLLGSIFLTPADAPIGNQQPGGLRDKRGEVTDWARWVTL